MILTIKLLKQIRRNRTVKTASQPDQSFTVSQPDHYNVSNILTCFTIFETISGVFHDNNGISSLFRGKWGQKYLLKHFFGLFRIIYPNLIEQIWSSRNTLPHFSHRL